MQPSNFRPSSSVSNRSVGASLKTVLLSVIGCLAAVGIAALGYQAMQSLDRYQRAAELDRTNAAGNHLVAGIYQVLLERLATNNALQADAPADAAARGQIEKFHKYGEDALAAGLPVILATDFPNKPALNDTLRAATAKAEDLRKRAADAIARAKAERDPELLKSFVPGMTDYINASLGVWTAALLSAKNGDPMIARYATLKQLGWTLRQVSGVERALIATAIAAGKQIPPEGLQQIPGYRAQVAQAWKLVQDLTADPSVDPAIRQAIAASKERYFAGFEPLADKMRQLSQAATAYPMSAAQWVNTTNPQIDSLLEIMYAAAKASEGQTAALEAGALSELTFTIIGIGLAVAIVAACFFIVLRRVTAPLGRLGSTVRTLAGGDLKVEVSDAARADEIGELARAVVVFKANMIKSEALAAEQEEIKSRAEAEKRAVLKSVADEFERSVRSVVDAFASTASQMQSTAQSMAASAEQTQRQSAAVASASKQTSANVQTMAASAEEMTGSISEIARQVAQAAQIAKRAVEDAQRTNGTVNTLAEAAQKIGQVVQLIQDIASQTNLLALNATIEAARAGEAGKGFAVVASEVKSLANQTARATEEIAAQIGSMQSVTGEAVAAIQGIGGTIGHINEISTAIASAVEEQGAATQEIARNTQQAAKGTEQVSSNIAGVNRAAGETGAAAAQVLSSAEQLGQQSEALRADVNRFLEKIRAA